MNIPIKRIRMKTVFFVSELWSGMATETDLGGRKAYCRNRRKVWKYGTNGLWKGTKSDIAHGARAEGQISADEEWSGGKKPYENLYFSCKGK